MFLLGGVLKFLVVIWCFFKISERISPPTSASRSVLRFVFPMKTYQVQEEANIDQSKLLVFPLTAPWLPFC